MLVVVLKIPKEKLPYIGIRYFNTSSGESDNKEFFLNHLKKELRIVIEVLPNHLNVKLVCDETLKIKAYTHVKYNAEILKNWLYIRNTKECNFGITVLENDKEKLLKVWDRVFINLVVKIKKLDILELKEESFGNW